MRFLRLSLSTIAVLALVAMSLFYTSTSSHAQTSISSTEGTDFFVTFDTNFQNTGTNQYLYLSSRLAGTATITWPDNSTDTLSLLQNSITTVNATNKGIVNLQNVSEISKRSAHISSDTPISVYGANIQSFTSDAFVAIPTESLSNQYQVISWFDAWYQQISVVATQPGTTTVTITPSVFLAGNIAGQPFTKILQQGDVYTATDFGKNLSGTIVTADKNIVVTSSLSCASLGGQTCDYMTAYMPPLNSWGKSFILPGSLNKTRADKYAILAKESGTVVTINGNEVATLETGQVFSYEGRISNSTQLADVVETSAPVLIAQGLPKGSFGASNQSGDPAFSLVTPSAQFLKKYTVATPSSGFAVNSLTLVAKSSAISSVTLNGTNVSSDNFTPIDGSDYSVARIEIPAGNYSVSSSSGIGVYVSGFNFDNSYAYPGGYALVNLISNPGGVDSIEDQNNDENDSRELAATGRGLEPVYYPLVFGALISGIGAAFLLGLRKI